MWERSETFNIEIEAIREQTGWDNQTPLTLAEMRQMEEPVLCFCKSIEGDNWYWCICQKGTIITPAGFGYDVEETPNLVFFSIKAKE